MTTVTRASKIIYIKNMVIDANSINITLFVFKQKIKMQTSYNLV
jgi:hypothetical protein